MPFEYDFYNHLNIISLKNLRIMYKKKGEGGTLLFIGEVFMKSTYYRSSSRSKSSKSIGAAFVCGTSNGVSTLAFFSALGAFFFAV